ncbi:MAG: PH domain-containing protein [Eggerthellaceae bacterium]|nr:PH domain-containing protein [Eggerthellaceae bacterium]
MLSYCYNCTMFPDEPERCPFNEKSSSDKHSKSYIDPAGIPESEHVLLRFATESLQEKINPHVVGALAVSSNQTEYVLTNIRLCACPFGHRIEDETEFDLKTMSKVSVKQNLSDRMRGTGNLVISFKDDHAPLTIANIKDPAGVAQMISSAFDAQ